MVAIFRCTILCVGTYSDYNSTPLHRWFGKQQ